MRPPRTPAWIQAHARATCRRTSAAGACGSALAHNAHVDRQIEALVLSWIVEQRGSFLAEHQRLLSTSESWRRDTAGRQPWGAWIALHDALPAGDQSFLSIPSAPVRRVWFLDAGGSRERSAWEYVRFHVVHSVQPWCGRTTREVPAIFGRVHEIGLAHFAQFAGTSDVYAGMQWGSLWGRGVRLAVQGDRVVEVNLLWVS